MSDTKPSPSFVITPLPDDGHRGVRLEIDEFCLDNEMTNLFLLALHSMQQNSLDVNGKGPSSNPGPGENGYHPSWFNFYNLGAIHGEPQELWNGVGSKPSEGYCHHGLDTFPIWHRPYVTAFELAVYQEMVKQANDFKDGERVVYQAAAARFRLPYWDIIMPRNPVLPGARPDNVWGIPKLLGARVVWVKKPKGFDQIENPLYSFKFPKQAEWETATKKYNRVKLEMDSAFNQVATNRVPNANGETDDNQTTLFNTIIQRQATALATMLLQMLNPSLTGKDIGDMTIRDVRINDQRKWSNFANHNENTVIITDKGQEHPVVLPSLESWHDLIHVMVGTAQWEPPNGLQGRFPNRGPNIPSPEKSGHMGDIRYAAFDPIFWLHHCNVERIVALYQAVFFRNEQYLDAKQDPELLPFLNGEPNNACWRAQDQWIKGYWNSGFAMPGNTPPGNTDAAKKNVQARVMEYLTATYQWASNGSSPAQALPGWPKDLSHCWALSREDPSHAGLIAPPVQFTALRMVADAPMLVSQSNTRTTAATLPAIQVTPIETAKILSVSNGIDNSLPNGVFTSPNHQVTWNSRIRVRKYALDGSFSIHLFIGDIENETPNLFMKKKNEAGFMGVFSKAGGTVAEGCANCQQQREDDVVLENAIPLTTLLYDYLTANPKSNGLIENGQYRTIVDLTPEVVVPFLREQLKWRMIDLQGNLVEGQEERSRLEVTVTSRSYSPPSVGNIMGEYGGDTIHPEVTNNKAGGRGYVYADHS